MSRIPGLKKEPSLASSPSGPTQLPRFGITLPQDKEEEVAEVSFVQRADTYINEAFI